MNYEQKFALAESRGEEGAFARIDETHPVGIFLGLEAGERAILVVCSRRPPAAPSLGAIRVEMRPRQGGEWALVLRLARPDLKALFTRLVEDLDSATRQRPLEPGEVVIERLARWQRLLSPGTSGLLDDRELRGLVAELDFLVSEAIPSVGPRGAVAAWAGSRDGPKDFVFETAEIEVKAIHSQQREIQISSLEQLTDAGLPLYLWCRVVELGSVGPGDLGSVAAFVGRVRASVASDATACQRLEDGLLFRGYEDRPEYVTVSVRFGSARCLHVAEGFPRIQRPHVAAGVVTCSYGIAVTGLDPFLVVSWRGGHFNAE